MQPRHRTVVKEASFEAEARQLIPDLYTRELVFEALDTLLGHAAELGTHIAHGIYFIADRPKPLPYEVAVLYTFDEDEVVCHQIRRRAL